ncbi:porin [Noviherbaspirillum galbum]|uniref:Porin n=1 Tax=Noviherbaspirillum galbum TaxID=2709383 RepID=A0A6B3SZJ2_9BURK|nr:porin [Noviherbaspirillum galbum]NEX64772.1 porin [Noviherbaspirillum galbum]
MKSSAIAIGMLALTSGAASAQTNVALYGIVDLGVKYEKGLSTAGGTWAVASGQQFGSRIGFRGTEDLGGGLAADFLLENGFNADDGSLNNGGRLWGRQAWAGLRGGFGSLYLGRQYSATYNALNAIDPFGLNQAGDAQRVYGYGLGKVDPISRSDNTVTYATPILNGFKAALGHKFGETAGAFNAGSSKFIGLSYVGGPLNIQASYQNTDGVALGAATTQLGSIIVPAGLGAATVTVKNAFMGGMYDFGLIKAHLGYGDTKLGAVGTTTIRNYLVGASAPVAGGTAIASWNRTNLRDIAAGASNQYAFGYSYPLSKRTNLYTSASYTRNDGGVRLSAASNGDSAREFQAGIRHVF